MSADLNFTSVDVQAVVDDTIKAVEEHTGELLYPGDERRIFTEAVAYVLAVFVSKVNEQCKGRMLSHARGYQLDALGERVNCTRLAARPASVELSFTLDTPRPNDILIPAHTAVTADNKVIFETDEAATIRAGELSVTGVRATSTTAGTESNGVPAGAIQSFVDRVPFVSGVVNTTASGGGDAGEPYPLEVDADNGDDGAGDENYRERIRAAVAGFSCAGGAASYEYFARSASSAVGSVSVVSDQEAGSVNVYVTENGGAEPTAGTLAAVRAAVTDDAVRPLNDRVTVSAPESVVYDIELTYYVSQADESACVAAIEGAGGALDEYKAWQQAEIGRDINPDRLRAFLLEKCIRLDVVQPKFRSVSRSEIARHSGNIRISHVTVSE